MDFICIGKLINTHGIKGEVRIISDFKYKDEVFKIDNKIYINTKEYIIKSYRHHKNFDMVTLNNIDNINEALNLKGYSVYINKNDYKFSGILDEELVGLSVYDNDTYKGKIIEVLKTVNGTILVVGGIKRHLIPNIPEFIDNIDLINKKINIKYIKGLEHED